MKKFTINKYLYLYKKDKYILCDKAYLLNSRITIIAKYKIQIKKGVLKYGIIGIGIILQHPPWDCDNF